MLETETINSEIKLASRWARLGASLLDAIILMISNWILSTALLVALHFAHIIDLRGNKLAAQTYANIFGLCLSIAYFLFFTFLWSATPGKRMLGIKVVSEDAKPLSTPQIILREFLGRWAGIFVLGNLWLLFNKRKKTASDYLARTLVVKK